MARLQTPPISSTLMQAKNGNPLFGQGQRLATRQITDAVIEQADLISPDLGDARVLPPLGGAGGWWRAWVRVLDEDDGILACLVDVFPPVSIVQPLLRLF